MSVKFTIISGEPTELELKVLTEVMSQHKRVEKDPIVRRSNWVTHYESTDAASNQIWSGTKFLMRLILASQSPSRKRLLEGAGLHPEIMVSNVDEETEHFNAMAPADMVIALAITKAHTVLEQIEISTNSSTLIEDALIIACDSTFEFEGESFGKPSTPELAIARAKRLSGKSGLLHTGHCIIDTKQGRELADRVTTKVTFDKLDEHLIEDYVATGEPLKVAGGFTLDGYSSPLINSIDGDYTNVVGISMSYLRKSLEHLGYPWPAVKKMGAK